MVDVVTNESVRSQVISSVEGKQTHGDIALKALMSGDEMTLLEIRYAPGAGTPMHVHQHESVVYVLSGRVSTTVAKETFELGPGDVCRHPRGVPHSVDGIEESVVIEIKSPVVPIDQFLGVS
jgi:quercetin dioxygenase-like cupin family protein